ncbi:phosphatidate cytidylyltransferase, mitochondrial [Sipha flava]|uniref:Phosphatidate cytidylyltransferase, mitochondrial n=1 Tax=Sipha flava TaxID=143950 RepID=A0A2S2R1Q0_9HEMI|nr:phosphatidate cytidylyltransferase, mitochondrial [Sipha flava]
MLMDLNRILARFPSRHFVYCFAYGSGVFHQAGRTERAMVDLIFVVNNTHGFHQDNLDANPDDYSSIRLLGPSVVSSLQKQFGANVYFNTLVSVGNLTFKYGIIDVQDFRRDLQSWHTLYIAGRLHKPVLTLYDQGLSELVEYNLKCAVHAALLQLPNKFSEEDFYTMIAGLSYRGDFRMIIGEDKNKVSNIVQPQIEKFRSLYTPVFKSMSHRLSIHCSSFEQENSLESKCYHLQRLPQNLKDILHRSYKFNDLVNDENKTFRELAKREDVGKIVRNGIFRIVFYSALMQSIKGIPTAGLLKSIVYSYNKLNKMVKSMFL